MKALTVFLAIFLTGIGTLTEAVAQQRGEVYAAPGMPVRIQGPVTAPASRPARKAIPLSVNKAEAMAPAFQPITSPTFPRFWHEAEPVRSQAGRNYYQFQRQNIKYPVTSLRAGVGGSVAALLTVLPNGKVGVVRITRRVLDESATSIEAPTPAAEEALDAEVIRVASQMRFEPSALSEDTVTVIQRFVFQ